MARQFFDVPNISCRLEGNVLHLPFSDNACCSKPGLDIVLDDRSKYDGPSKVAELLNVSDSVDCFVESSTVYVLHFKKCLSMCGYKFFPKKIGTISRVGYTEVRKF